MLKSLFKNKYVTKGFCSRVELFPDQIVEHVRTNVGKKQELSDIEATVINNIHFFDSDQFVDLYVTFAKADRGSDRLWDLLTRKVYDYEFDTCQRVALLDATEKCLKSGEDVYMYLYQPILRRLASQDGRNKISIYEKVLH
jgi:hypothetical protein